MNNKVFQSHKKVTATPMNRLDYNVYRGWELPSDEDGTDEGYLVEYLDGGTPNHADHKGYISWSPKEQFDNGYTPAPSVTHSIATGADRAAFVQAILATATHVYNQLPGTNYTVCVSTFADGWSMTGQSVCVDPADFNQELGETIARDNAISDAETHYWRTSGYLAMIGQTEISYGNM